MRSAVLLLLSTAACSPPSDPGSPDPAGGEQTASGAEVVELSSLAVQWLPAADGDFVTGVTLVGDLDGDGYVDAAVDVQTPDDNFGTTYLVHGPLRTSHTFPGDAVAATLPHAAVLAAGDGDGDGILDLDVYPEDASYNRFVPGPFAGEVDVAATGTDHGGVTLVDVDGDGILDEVASGGLANGAGTVPEVDVVFGPVERFAAGIPDIRVAPSCPGSGPDDWNLTDAPQAWPDVTGDGVPELYVPGFSYFNPDSFNPCSNYVLPLPGAGTVVDPEQDAAAASGIRPVQAVGDQDGDGIADVYVKSEARIATGPVVFSAGVVSGVDSLPLDPALTTLVPQAFDLDGDGSADFVGTEEVVSTAGTEVEAPLSMVSGDFLVAVHGGAAGLSNVAPAIAWNIQGGGLASGGAGFVEDGVASVFVVRNGTAYLVDLGPAAPR